MYIAYLQLKFRSPVYGVCGYSLGFLGEGASNDSGVVEECNFERLLLAICSETLDRIIYCSLQINSDQQESRAVAEKPHDAVVKFDTYRNLQRHRAVLLEIARTASCLRHNVQLL